MSDFATAVVDEAEPGVRVARVAAELGLRRLLQHDDALGAGLARSNRRFMRRAAATDHDDVALFPTHSFPPARMRPALVGTAPSIRSTNEECQTVTGSLRGFATSWSEPKPFTEMSKLLPSGSVARVSA